MAIRIEPASGHRGVLILLLIGLIASNGVSGQEAVVPLQFSFSDPGARSMGFGGAFVALADDATAAIANPAGLVQLIRPEVSIEGRHWGYSTQFTAGGRAEGLPSGHGIDTTVGVRTATSNDDIAGLSFVSFVYPKENWSLAVFRHQLANFEFFSETQGLFSGGSDCCQIRDFDQRVSNNMDIVSYGLSAAFRVSDSFSLGLGLAYYDASFISDATLYAPDDESAASVFAPNSYLPERSLLNEIIAFDDTDWAVTAGFLWQLSRHWNFGGVYRQAPEIGIGIRLTAGPAAEPVFTTGEVILQDTGVMELPDFFGLGLAYRATDGRLTVTFQWDRVEYSSLVDSLNLEDRAIDDVDELHLGAEYVLLGSTPIIALRLGTWLEPDHQMRATTDEPLVRALLPSGDDELHITAGLGVATKNFQIDLGFDFADPVDTVSLSAIHNF